MAARGWLTPGTDIGEPSLPAMRDVPRLILFGAGQIVLFLILFQLYKVVRRTFITRAEGVAFDNALQILDIQGALHANFELDLQRWVLERGDLIMVFNYFYAWFMWVFYAAAMILLFFAPRRYLYLRRVFFLSMLLALPWYIIYPLAPPRFMQDYGWEFVDTLVVYGPNYFSETGLVTANRYAAMPSMHVGWTTIAALMLWVAFPGRFRIVGKALAVFLVALITFTVMVTGNHYWLDAVGGWIIIGAAVAINRWLPWPFPMPWSEPSPRSERQPAAHPA
ncbi:MAG TPA: phosphatase PAP2 family protein [Thermomicrobiales bacterium]|nr:phosphatase PAP2 family protein [Thermomicrobiales bacterium]